MQGRQVHAAIACKRAGCSKKNHARGYCTAHFCKFRKYGDPLYSPKKEIKKCQIGSCVNKVVARGLCSTHYCRWKKHGEPMLAERFYGQNKYTTRTGYVMVKLPDHPNSHKTGYVFEHTLILSQILGRPLRYPETVHHKNGIRNDNRPENLELWATSHRPGQRVSDLVSFALEILTAYHDTKSVFTKATAKQLSDLKNRT